MRAPLEPAKAGRRIRQLEQCLRAVTRLLFDRAVELNAAGRDEASNPEYQCIQRIHARIQRTLGEA